MGSTQLHEPAESLSAQVIDQHRAIVSLMEELEAVDWYSQRVEATQDEELAKVLAHNRDEEIEHACMTLEWLRRNNACFDEQLRKFLFKQGPIRDERGPEREDDERSLAIGSRRSDAARGAQRSA